jgi:dual specificity tyrosine-phosphorylation-regulated kinase 2/3/4
MWSFGCILVELFVGFPIFPGESEKEQLAYQMQYRGVPPIDVLEQSTRGDIFFDENLEPFPVKNSAQEEFIPNTKSIQQFLECDDKWFVKFIDGCLHWDPEMRMTPDEALLHRWVTNDEKEVIKEIQEDNSVEEKIKKMFEEKRSNNGSNASIN